MKRRLPYKKITKTLLPHLALIVVALIWAIAAPVIKLAYKDISVFLFLFYRFLLVGVVILPYFIFELKKDPINKKDFPNLIILAFASQVSILLIFLGLNLTTAIDTAVISVIAPILTFIAGAYYYKEKVTKMEELGIGLAVFGTLFIILAPILSKNGMATQAQIGKRILGNFFVLLYQFSWPVYTILGRAMMGNGSARLKKTFKFLHLKKLQKPYRAETLTFFSFYVGLLVFMLLGIGEVATGNAMLAFTIPAISGIFYMGIFSSIVAYLAYQWAIDKVETQEAAIYAYLNPVFTIPAAYLLLGEIPTLATLLGGGIIALGVVIAEKFKN